jgi:RimJ/RimL family protein N-acetyltransferase
MFATTERLLLRPPWTQDAPALFRAISDEGVVRNLAKAPWPYLPEHAEAYAAGEQKASEPSMLIFRRTREAPELIGGIGFGRKPTGEVELGYWIARAHWGRGYATEAGHAAAAMARGSLRLDRLEAGHFLDNPASGRVLEKLGFRPTGAVVPRYSTGRGEAVACRLFCLDLRKSGTANATAEADSEPAFTAT